MNEAPVTLIPVYPGLADPWHKPPVCIKLINATINCYPFSTWYLSKILTSSLDVKDEHYNLTHLEEG